MTILQIEIKNSLDWSRLENKLCRLAIERINNPRNFADVQQMIKNVGKKVSNLSKLEVECRRIRSFRKTEDLIREINKDIALIEEFILVAALVD